MTALPSQFLGRGISLTRWGKNNPAPVGGAFDDLRTYQWYAERVSNSTLDKLRNLRIKYLRFPIKVEKWESNSWFMDAAYQTYERTLNAGFGVLHDPFHESATSYTPDFLTSIIRSSSGTQAFLDAWYHQAIMFSSLTGIHFEAMNEPGQNISSWTDSDLAAYTALMEKMIDTVRGVRGNAKRWIHVGFPSWDVFTTRWTPPDRDRVCLHVHDYGPFVRTHAGANWFTNIWQELRYLSPTYTPGVTALTYPFDSDNANTVKAQVPTRTNLVSQITAYGNTEPGAAAIASRATTAKAWAAAHGYPLILGEYGCLENSDRAGMIRYLNDIRANWPNRCWYAEFGGYTWADSQDIAIDQTLTAIT